MKKTRCAIYTRKSSEDRLEQEFNSLDAQREACEAYIASQRQEGWVLLPQTYDDGGLRDNTECALQCLVLLEWLAVETVMSEPVSGPFSLFNRENTGKMCGFG